MLLKIGHVFFAAPVITAIINQNRPLPQKGTYRIARMYAKLKPEYDLIAAARDKLMEPYDYKVPFIDGKQVEATEENLNHANVTMVMAVPPEKMPEFTKAWSDYANEEIEVGVEPIPLSQLDNGGGYGAISAAELITLDDLVKED